MLISSKERPKNERSSALERNLKMNVNHPYIKDTNQNEPKRAFTNPRRSAKWTLGRITKVSKRTLTGPYRQIQTKRLSARYVDSNTVEMSLPDMTNHKAVLNQTYLQCSPGPKRTPTGALDTNGYFYPGGKISILILFSFVMQMGPGREGEREIER
jgi:hypothetical protein